MFFRPPTGADAGFRVRGGASGVSHIRKVGGGGGGGGGAFRFRYLWAHRKHLHVPTYVLLGILHTRARMKVKYMPAKVFCHPYVRGGVRPPRPPPKSATDLERQKRFDRK